MPRKPIPFVYGIHKPHVARRYGLIPKSRLMWKEIDLSDLEIELIGDNYDVRPLSQRLIAEHGAQAIMRSMRRLVAAGRVKWEHNAKIKGVQWPHYRAMKNPSDVE